MARLAEAPAARRRSAGLRLSGSLTSCEQVIVLRGVRCSAPPPRERWRSQVARGTCSHRRRGRRISCSSWRTIWGTRTLPVTDDRTCGRQISIASRQMVSAAGAGLRQLRRLHGDADGAHYRSLPGSSASRARGAAPGRQHRWSSSRTSDASFASEKNRVRHDPDRKMAPGFSADVRAIEEWLRSFLRLSRRGARLLHAPGHRPQRRSLGR